jgi:hypothetical protein
MLHALCVAAHPRWHLPGSGWARVRRPDGRQRWVKAADLSSGKFARIRKVRTSGQRSQDLGTAECGNGYPDLAFVLRRVPGFGRFVCCQIAAKNDQVPFVVRPKGTLTRAFVVAGTGFEPVTSGL